MKQNPKTNSKKSGRKNSIWKKGALTRTRLAREVLPKLLGKTAAKKMLKPSGRAKTGKTSVTVSLRLPPKTLARWKATGSGWQTRMAQTLNKAV